MRREAANELPASTQPGRKKNKKRERERPLFVAAQENTSSGHAQNRQKQQQQQPVQPRQHKLMWLSSGNDSYCASASRFGVPGIARRRSAVQLRMTCNVGKVYMVRRQLLMRRAWPLNDTKFSRSSLSPPPPTHTHTYTYTTTTPVVGLRLKFSSAVRHRHSAS